MSSIGQPERVTQNRVIALFQDLGYTYLGDWTDRTGNSNVEAVHLGHNLKRRGYTQPQISRALHILRTEADNHSRGLYGNNKAVYSLLRYGVSVAYRPGQFPGSSIRAEAGKAHYNFSDNTKDYRERYVRVMLDIPFSLEK